MLFFIKKLFRCGKPQKDHSFSLNSFAFKKETPEEFRSFVYKWNTLLPIDKWYRSKYKLKFNSKEHREISFLSMLFEFEEEKAYREIGNVSKYIPNEGNFLKKRKAEEKKLTMEDVKKEFEQLDLSQFDD